MTSSPPLQYKTVLVPREKKQAGKFSQMVEKYGGIPVEIPLLAFRPKDISTEIGAILQRIEQYDWIIFTSNVTVDLFFAQEIPISETLPKIAAIGEKTAEVLKEKGFQVDFIPSQFVAERFVIDFSSYIHKGAKILIPKGNLARSYIATQLTQLGAIVDEVITYETYFPEESKAKLAALLSTHRLHVIPFTSPSTVDHFMEVVKEYKLFQKVQSCMFACIGPIAKERAEYFGLPVHVVPEVFTVESMIQEIARYVKSKTINGEGLGGMEK